MDSRAQFFQAVSDGDSVIVSDMLKALPELVSARDETGATPLHVAAFHARHHVMEILLAAGADINARDGTYDATPAGWALHFLRERGALLAIEIDDLHFAIQQGDRTWAQRFLTRHPALASAVDRDGTPLRVHATASQAGLAELFGAIEPGARPDLRGT